MTITAIISGIFAIFEAVPIMRDALYAAIDGVVARRVEAARQGRIGGYDELTKAQTPEQILAALGNIVRNRPQ